MQHCVISHSLNLYLGFSNLWPDPRPSSPEALLRTLVYIIKMHNTLNYSVHCSAVVLLALLYRCTGDGLYTS